MGQCWKPGDGTGMYECMLEAKKQGKIRHIGGTAHKIGIAKELAESGLYETVQYPISYLATRQETELIEIDRRRLVFKVKVYDSKSEVGSGTHERFVVDSMKFMEKAQLKKS